MLQEAEVKRLVENLIPILKKKSSIYLDKKKKDDYEFYPGYKLACEYAMRTRTHSEIGGYPEKLFEANAPNETDLERDYIKANFKQTTLPVYMDWNTSMGRMFNDNDWYMEFTPDEEKFSQDSLQKYLETQIRYYGSLENYVKSSVLHLSDIDGNGVLAVKPLETYRYNEEGQIGGFSEQELYEPQVYYYRIDQVVGKEYEKYFLIMLDERSIVLEGDKKVQEGFIFELYDDENIWRIEQTGKKNDYAFDTYIYFAHKEGVIPCKELGGIPQIIENNWIVYQPEFLYACDLLDIALVINQYLRATHANVCFPYRVMLGSYCDFNYHDASNNQDRCRNGRVYDSIMGREINCPECKGSGLRSRVSRTGQMLLAPSDNLKEGDTPQSIANAMYYVSPETAALQLTMDLEDKTINQARGVLHLKTTSTTAQPDKKGNTAIGDTLDQKYATTFIKPKSSRVFDTFKFLTDRIGWQRYAKDYKPVYFKYPNNFDTTSDTDILNRIATMQQANVPSVLIEAEIDRYIQSLYFNEKDSQDRYRLIAQADRFFFLSQDAIEMNLSKGTASKWEKVLHDSSSFLIDDLVIEHEADTSSVPEDNCIYPYVCAPQKGFFSNDFKTQRELLIAKAKEITDAIKSDQPVQHTAESVIKGIVNPPVAT